MIKICKITEPRIILAGINAGRPCVYVQFKYPAWADESEDLNVLSVEPGTDSLAARLEKAFKGNEGCGLCFTGDVLKEYRNNDLFSLIRDYKRILPFVSLNTDCWSDGSVLPSKGVIGPDISAFDTFIAGFTHVTMAISLTPSFPMEGRSVQDCVSNVPSVLNACGMARTIPAFCFGVNNEKDIEAVDEFVQKVDFHPFKNISIHLIVRPLKEVGQYFDDIYYNILTLAAKRGYYMHV